MPPLLKVTWIDAYAEAEWAWEIPEPEPQVCVTVGFLLSETDQYLLLAATIGGTHSNARFGIPKGCITEREEVSCQASTP